DNDGDELWAELYAGPSSAESFSFNADGTFDYVPLPGTTEDQFTYWDFDGAEYSNVATVRLTVSAGNPVPVDDYYTLDQNDVASDLYDPGILRNDYIPQGYNGVRAVLLSGVDPQVGTLVLSDYDLYDQSFNGQFAFTRGPSF